MNTAVKSEVSHTIQVAPDFFGVVGTGYLKSILWDTAPRAHRKAELKAFSTLVRISGLISQDDEIIAISLGITEGGEPKIFLHLRIKEGQAKQAD